MDDTAKLEALMSENAAMEKEIMNLTKGGTAMGMTAAAPVKKEGGGIKFMKFGGDATSGDAGVDHGSAFRPPQCARRTQLGGFFTS